MSSRGSTGGVVSVGPANHELMNVQGMRSRCESPDRVVDLGQTIDLPAFRTSKGYDATSVGGAIVRTFSAGIANVGFEFSMTAVQIGG